jgi:hypothetical protein
MSIFDLVSKNSEIMNITFLHNFSILVDKLLSIHIGI